MYYSSNNGTNWTQTATPFFTYAFAKIGNTLIVGVEATGILTSTNNGANWTQSSLNNRSVLALKVVGSNIFAGAETGVYLSTNNGSNWTLTSLSKRYVYSMAVIGTNIFASTEQGIYLSKDNGASWTKKNEGLSSSIIDGLRLVVSDNFIFASSLNTSVWRRSIVDIINVRLISTEVPSSYELKQNFPNPFNPVTKIIFSLPNNSHIALKIYDMQGKEIALLINEELKNGTYEYLFNGEYFPSGVYFYRMETPEFSQSKVMVLVK
jgi:hypothetical protein